MPWQIPITLYLIFGTINNLVSRKLGKTFSKYNKIINWIFFSICLYPMGVIVALTLGQSLYISWHSLVFILVGELIFPLISVIEYRANKDIDAGFFSIIKNLTPVITITTAWLLLNEGLSTWQILGATIIISSALIASLSSLSKKHHANKTKSVLLALLGIFLLGIAVTYERWMLTQMSFSAYLIYGWGAQTVWMTIIARPKRKDLEVFKDKSTNKFVLMYGFTKAFRGLA